MSLLAYVISVFLAHPQLTEVARATLMPKIQFNRDLLAILVAIIGTSLSAYLYVAIK